MKKVWILTISAALVALVLVGGVALAKTVRCDMSGGTCNGTNNADTIYGSDNSDNIDALAGNDVVHGRAGDDGILGGTGADKLNGNTGIDFVAPFKVVESENGLIQLIDNSNDTVWGGMGDDDLYGGGGQSGHDTVHGGKGNDQIIVSQRALKQEGFQTSVTKETVDCGPGTDTVLYDKGIDKISNNCENKVPFGPGGVQQQPVAAQNAMASAAQELEKLAH